MLNRRNLVLVSMVVAASLTAAGGVNSSIRVGDGEVREDSLSTVNGQIKIGDGSTVRGDAQTVNGSIDVGRNSQVKDLGTVNGSVSVEEGTNVEGSVQTVNGGISMERGTSAREVETVNGKIDLRGAEIEKDLSTYNGDVLLRDATVIGGDIVVEDPDSMSSRRKRPLRIEIEEGSTVQGGIRVENDDIEVQVYLRGGSSIAGEVRGARLIEE